MAPHVRTRLDVWKLSVGTVAAARTKPWHPVLDTYARGVRAMMDRNKNGAMTVDSWLWAANTHGVPQGTPGVKPLWRQCEHAAIYFLPWHRGYLAWFENTIRTLTGEADWALPYWDYTDPDRPETLGLPPEFLVDKRTVGGALVANPLFVTGRTGAPFAEDVELVDAMSETQFVRNHPREGFGGLDLRGFFGLVESEPHNLVHVDIGGLMRDPRTAGRDPIFYLHHSNIDRLWEVWRGLAGSTALLDQQGLAAQLVSEWKSAKFAYGGNGATKKYRMKDMNDTKAAPLRYDYESIVLPPAVAGVVDQARQPVPSGGPMGLDEIVPAEERWTPVAATADVAVNADGASAEMVFDTGQLGLDDTATVPDGLIIELLGVRGENPHDVYVVNVRSAPGAAPHRVGRISTFGVGAADDDESRSYLIDASDVLAALVDEGWAGGRLDVEVVPDATRGAADAAADPGIRIEQITVHVRS